MASGAGQKRGGNVEVRDTVLVGGMMNKNVLKCNYKDD
jgi:hypothetical protein